MFAGKAFDLASSFSSEDLEDEALFFVFVCEFEVVAEGGLDDVVEEKDEEFMGVFLATDAVSAP